MYKNIYGAKVLIPFGDFDPADQLTYATDTQELFYLRGDPTTGLLNEKECYGKFSYAVVLEIFEDWKKYREENHFDDDCLHWFPRS